MLWLHILLLFSIIVELVSLIILLSLSRLMVRVVENLPLANPKVGKTIIPVPESGLTDV
jgi:membrane-anchored glycerophosphoryl diester phosphodiesterase (GDPDase)